MTELEKELQEKRHVLSELIKSRSEASCSSTHSTSQDVQRETEIEDVEDEIQAIEAKIKIS